MKKKAYTGGIVKLCVKGMYGFHVGFSTPEEAQKYKDMFKWIMESDSYNIDNRKGYYEKKD